MCKNIDQPNQVTAEKATVGHEIVEKDSAEKAAESRETAEQAVEDFSCDICDFRSNWKN